MPPAIRIHTHVNVSSQAYVYDETIYNSCARARFVGCTYLRNIILALNTVCYRSGDKIYIQKEFGIKGMWGQGQALQTQFLHNYFNGVHLIPVQNWTVPYLF